MTYMRDNIANKWFGGVNFDIADILYFRLSTTPIVDDGTGVSEPVDTGYHALILPNNSTTFAYPVNGVVTTQENFTFTPMETTTSWTATHYFISTSPTSLNPNTFYSFGKLIYKKTAVAGTMFELESGDFVIELHSKELGASEITYQFANRILADIYGKRTVVVPSQYYFGLSSTPIIMNETTGELIGITELYNIDNTFMRASIANNKTYFTNSVDGAVTNAQDIRFDRFIEYVEEPILTTYYFISDVNNPTVPNQGNVFYFGELSTVLPIEIQTTPLLRTGKASIAISNCASENI